MLRKRCVIMVKEEETYGVETIIDNAEVNWTAESNVTSALDATDKKEGSNSVKLTVADVFATGLLASHDISSMNLSAYKKVKLWIKSSVARTAGDLQLLLDDTAACASPLETLDIPALSEGVWKEVELTLADPSLLTAIISVGLKAVVDPGACDIWVDHIRPPLNAILAFDPSFTPAGERLERDPVRTTLSQYPHLIGSRYREIAFQTELRGSGSLGVAPRTGDLFEACGMLETIVASTSVKYTPASSSLKSATIYAYIDGILYKLLGCVGSWEIIGESGKPAMVSWSLQGIYQDPADVALPSSVTYDSPTPPVCLSSAFKLNEVTTLIAQQVSLVLGNNIAQRDDINSADGIKGFVITRRNGSGSFNPEAVSKATYDFEGDWKSAAQRALEITLGTAGGNRVKISAPKVQIDAPTPAERNELFTFDVPFFLAMDTGDDEVTIFLD